MAKKKAKTESVDHVDGAEPTPGLTATAVEVAPSEPGSPPTPEAAATASPGADFKKWEGAIMVPIDKLIFTSWNVNEMNDAEFSELVAEIEDGGFDEPCDIVPAVDDPGSFLVLGGEHRVRACHSLAWKEVPCVIKKHLIGADEATLKMWSVKRNHIRGRVNAQKYADLERSLTEKHSIQLEAARNKMLIKGDLLTSLRKNEAVQDNEGVAGRGAGAGADGESSNGDYDGPATDGEKDKKKEVRDRKNLLTALKTAEEEVLLQSADTVEHGYLFFGQGSKGQLHLVVDTSPELAGLVKRAVAACKGESMKVDELLSSALAAELPKWEAK